MIDLDESIDQNDEISVGSGVLDLDVLSEENDEEEIKIHGMKSYEFYAYICTLIIIFIHLERRPTMQMRQTMRSWNCEAEK